MKVAISKDAKLLLVLIAALLLVGILILSNFLSSAHIEQVVSDLIIKNQVTETAHAAGRIEHHILSLRDELIALSHWLQPQELTAENCQKQPEKTNVATPLLITNTEGEIIGCSDATYGDLYGLNVANKEYFIKPTQQDLAYITGILKQGGTAQILVSVPRNAQDPGQGILFTIIDIDELFNKYIHPYVSENNKEYLIRNKATNELLLQSDGIANIPLGNLDLTRGWTITTLPYLGDILITSADLILGNTDLELIIVSPLATQEPNMQSLQQRHLFGLLFIILVSALATGTLIFLYKKKEEYQTQYLKAHKALEQLGITVETEESVFSNADIDLNSGNMYLIREDDENTAYELFTSTLNKGYAGLGIVREDPEKIKKRYNLSKTSFIWLSEKIGGQHPAETNMKKITTLIAAFIEESEKGVILIDRLDYLISINKFPAVEKAIQILSDKLHQSQSIIILAANPHALTEQQFAKIGLETIDLLGTQLTKNTALTELENDILQLINDNNTQNKITTFKDINKACNITKPTTRAKIQNLSSLGLIKVEQRGRSKALRITSAGRRLLR